MGPLVQPLSPQGNQFSLTVSKTTSHRVFIHILKTQHELPFYNQREHTLHMVSVFYNNFIT